MCMCMAIARSAVATSSMAIALVAVVVLAMFISLPGVVADEDSVAGVCKDLQAVLHVSNDNCVPVLSADPRSSRAVTEHDFAGIALDLAVAEAQGGVKVINDRFARHRGTPAGEALRICGDAYLGAATGLDSGARASFHSGDYGSAARLLVSAGLAGDECERAFPGRRVRSVMADVNKMMGDVCSVARDLMYLLLALPPAAAKSH